MQSFYEKLQGSTLMLFPRKTIWRPKAPQRVSFFVWTAARRKILTTKNLIKIFFSMVSCVVCAIVARRLWITSWFIVTWLSSYGALFLGCLGFSGFYRKTFLIYYVGGEVVDQLRISEILSLYVWCGLNGGNEIGIFLKRWSASLLKYKHPSLILYSLLHRVNS